MRRRPPSAVRLPLALLLLAGPVLAAPPDGGASVAVQVDEHGDTTLDVRKGEVKVKAGGQVTRVQAGQTVRAQKGKPLRRLLPTPTPVAPADGATVGNPQVAFAWQKVPGAAKYVLVVAAAPELTGSAARSVTVTEPKAVLPLASGIWYWRVTALDARGTPGKRGPARRLTIDTTPPKLKTGKPEWH